MTEFDIWEGHSGSWWADAAPVQGSFDTPQNEDQWSMVVRYGRCYLGPFKSQRDAHRAVSLFHAFERSRRD